MHGPSRGGSSFGGRSHSSGGGGSRSGGSSHSGSYIFRGPRHFHIFGRTVVVTSGKFGLMIFLIIALLFASLISWISSSSLSDLKKTVGYYQSDEIGFNQLIGKAEKGDVDDGYYIKEIKNINFRHEWSYHSNNDTYYDCYVHETGDGTVLVAEYFLTYDDIDYFQIIYSFNDDGRKVFDYTYASFSYTDINNMSILRIAYQYQNGKLVDSINADYSLESCMDYHDALDDLNGTKTLLTVALVIVGVIAVTLVSIIVVTILKAKKDSELKEQKAQAEIEKTKAETELVNADLKKKNRYCAYCGNPIPDGAENCPSCGSRLPK